jgi:hypothetical protein
LVNPEYVNVSSEPPVEQSCVVAPCRAAWRVTGLD